MRRLTMISTRDRVEEVFAYLATRTEDRVFLKLYSDAARAAADAVDSRRRAGFTLGLIDGQMNPHYGMPGNAADPSRIPGGSSSGTAVSVGREATTHCHRLGHWRFGARPSSSAKSFCAAVQRGRWTNTVWKSYGCHTLVGG